MGKVAGRSRYLLKACDLRVVVLARPSQVVQTAAVDPILPHLHVDQRAERHRPLREEAGLGKDECLYSGRGMVSTGDDKASCVTYHMNSIVASSDCISGLPHPVSPVGGEAVPKSHLALEAFRSLVIH